jgi:hypothetical protein
MKDHLIELNKNIFSSFGSHGGWHKVITSENIKYKKFLFIDHKNLSSRFSSNNVSKYWKFSILLNKGLLLDDTQEYLSKFFELIPSLEVYGLAKIESYNMIPQVTKHLIATVDEDDYNRIILPSIQYSIGRTHDELLSYIKNLSLACDYNVSFVADVPVSGIKLLNKALCGNNLNFIGR